MKKIGYNKWFINQQKENSLTKYKKVTLYRRYWDSPNQEYIWENNLNVEIDQDIIKCGKITWKADTVQLNVWKMGNISLTVDNSHGKWDINNASGYFDGYTAFLSIIRIEVGFISNDGSIYEIFSYQGLITQDGIKLENEKHEAKIKLISLDYLIKSINAEEVSKKPVYPELRYNNANIYSSTTIGKTGSGWSTNAYQYKIIRITGGVGIGQERLIQSNTTDTLTVNTWEITPDSTSDFEIVGEYMGVGDDSQTEWSTIQPGVGIIQYIWINDTLKYQGNHYNLSNLNEASIGAKVAFETPPTTGGRIVCDYIYWYQDETFKFLIEKILDLGNITNRFIQDITFPEDLGVNVEVEWEQTSQTDWQAGTLIQSNAIRYPGDIIADDNIGITEKGYYTGSETENGIHEWQYNINYVGYQHAQNFIAKKTAYIAYIDLYLKFFGTPGSTGGTLVMQLCADNSGDPGTVLATCTNSPTLPSDTNAWITFLFDNYRLNYGTSYWIKYYRVGADSGGQYTPIGSSVLSKSQQNSIPNINKHFATTLDGGSLWDHSGRYVIYDLFAEYRFYYHPYYTYGIHFSQTYDTGIGTPVTSWGKIETNETLNNGMAVYYTQTRNTDSGWSTSWDPTEWDLVDSFDNITSPIKRYIRVAVYFAPNLPGGHSTSEDIDTPFIHGYTIKYYLSDYKPALANFTDKNGKSAIEVMATLGNYEMGFFTDFNDSENMVWNKEYDGTVMPQTDGWTENKEYNGSGSIVDNKLEIEGSPSIVTVGTINDAGYYIWNKVCLVEYSSNLYMSSGTINTVYRYDEGTTWVSIGSLPEFASVTSLISFGGNLYAGVSTSTTAERGVYRYDGGTTWTKVSSFLDIAVYSLHEYDGDMYAGTSNGNIYRYDGGTTWTQVGNFSPTYSRIRYMATYNGNLYACMDSIPQSDGGAVYIYNGESSWTEVKIFTDGRIGGMIVCENYLYVGTNDIVYKYDETIWRNIGLNVNNPIGSLGVHNGELYIGSEQNSNLYVYNGKALTYLFNTVNSVWGMVEFDNKLYVGLGVLPTEIKEFEGAGHCFYDIVDTDLDPRNGWTVETFIQKESGSDENLIVMVEDGTYITKVAITNLGYLKLIEYDKNDLTKSKKADFPIGSQQILKIARKNNIVKIYVNNNIVLCSYVNTPGTSQKISFGQLEDTDTHYKDVVEYVKYNNSIPSFETFYLPKYYFQNKESIVDTGLVLKADDSYIKIYNYENGWDRIYNHIKSDYGGYSYYATPVTELDESPNSKDKYGKRALSISGEDFLTKADTNVAIGTAKRYYGFYKVPRRRFKVFCEYLFQLNLSNKIYIDSDTPIELSNLPCKIIGIVLDIDKYTLDLDVEEII